MLQQREEGVQEVREAQRPRGGGAEADGAEVHEAPAVGEGEQREVQAVPPLGRVRPPSVRTRALSPGIVRPQSAARAARGVTAVGAPGNSGRGLLRKSLFFFQGLAPEISL